MFQADSPGLKLIAPTELGNAEFKSLAEREGTTTYYSNTYPMYGIFVDESGSVVGSIFIDLESALNGSLSPDDVFEVLVGVDIVDGNALRFELSPGTNRVIRFSEAEGI
jgi:hypothetical protein